MDKDKKAIKIAIYNNKGGVGKSTFLINFASALAKKDKKVLVIDNDGQSNATLILTGMGEDDVIKNYGMTIYDLMTDDDVEIKECIVSANAEKFPNIDIIPAIDDHADTPEELASVMDNSRIMARKLKEIDKEYDFILIDNPPTRDLNVYNCLFAADVVLSPVETQLFSQRGLGNLIKQIAKANKRRDTPLLHYVFLSKVDNRQEKINKEVKEHLHDLLGEDFLEQQISLRSQYVKSLTLKESVFDFKEDKKKYITMCIDEVNHLTDEILNKIEEDI